MFGFLGREKDRLARMAMGVERGERAGLTAAPVGDHVFAAGVDLYRPIGELGLDHLSSRGIRDRESRGS